jgi:hypothetical protein
MSNCIIEGDIIFSSFKSWEIIIQSTTIKWSITGDSEYSEWTIDYWILWKIDLRDCNISNPLSINNSEIDTITLVNTETKWVNINNVKVQSLYIEWSDIHDLSLINCNPKEDKKDFSIDLRLTWNWSIINNINLISCNNISNLKIIDERCEGKEYPQINLRIDNIIFEENTDVFIDWPKLWIFTINNVAILWRKFKLNNILINEYLSIHDTNFWHTIFNGLTLTKKCKKFIKLSVFNDCIFNNVNWINTIFELENQTEKLKNTLPEQCDNYRQLKYVLDSNWNHTEANKFFGKEMEYYGKTLDFLNIKFSRLLNPNWWLFLMQLLISNFWNSWVRPILWILILSNLALIFENTFTLYWIPTWIDWNSYSKDIVKHLTPFTELAKGENISLLKFLYNILIIFLVYHFSVAIKRTTKR